MDSALLEICIASVSDALAAVQGGADRLELNCALSLGGLTPSLGLVAEVKAAASVPVLVMIRPRAGDFVYGRAEIQVMCRDIELALAQGGDGVVFGVLDHQGSIDLDCCKRLLAAAGERPAVFHRAFDFCPDPCAALEQLVDLGFQRVLTSGQRESALDGSDRIARLRDQAAGRLGILPAGGITVVNVAEVVARTGCGQVHASLRQTRCPGGVLGSPVRLNSAGMLPDYCHEVTDSFAVRQMKELLRQSVAEK